MVALLLLCVYILLLNAYNSLSRFLIYTLTLLIPSLSLESGSRVFLNCISEGCHHKFFVFMSFLRLMSSAFACALWKLRYKVVVFVIKKTDKMHLSKSRRGTAWSDRIWQRKAFKWKQRRKASWENHWNDWKKSKPVFFSDSSYS